MALASLAVASALQAAGSPPIARFGHQVTGVAVTGGRLCLTASHSRCGARFKPGAPTSLPNELYFSMPTEGPTQ